MRILIKECKKILDTRLLLILCVFTLLFYRMFMQIVSYPSGGQGTNSSYDIPFAAELVKELGPSLKMDDFGKLDAKIAELKNEYHTIIASNEILKSAGITTFDEMKDYHTEVESKDEADITNKEHIVADEIERLIFFNKTTSKLTFELQYAEHINRSRGIDYGVPKDQVTSVIKEYYNRGSALYQKSMNHRITKDTLSLLPDGMLFILQSDMKSMAILLLIHFLVLIVPYQVKERLRKVTPLYAATHTGRKIYQKQFLASVLSCGVVGILQLLVYLCVYIGQGLTLFWKCKCWSDSNNCYWCDNLSFGTYMVIYLFLVLLFSLAGVVIAYLIGRMAVNYIAGIAMSIPIGGVICIFIMILFGELFSFDENTTMVLWELPCIAVWILFTFLLIMCRLKKDRTADVC